ncbi:MAG: hypothetical protein DMG45_14660 [Acidobacteria bacterium]|nr:MAG: hypothetical protein DMG45_14660 [Acidobacteriota bacterium]
MLPLSRREHAPQKCFSIPFNCRLNPLDLRNVHAHANDQDASIAPLCCPAADSDYTGRLVASTKTVTARHSARKPGVSFSAGTPWAERSTRGIRILQVPTLTKFSWLIHGFSTKPGGVSDQDGEKVLNLGFTEWDTKENVLENRRRFQSALDASGLKLVSLKQIHSDVIHLFDAAPAQPCQGDASVTSRPGLLLGAQTADCVPILIVDPKKRTVAAVHAGWRGTLARIVVKAIGQMQMQFKTKPADLLAAIGPSIGGCCYEVGTEVATQFLSQFADAPEWFDEFRTGDERTQSYPVAEHDAARPPAPAEERPPRSSQSQSRPTSRRRLAVTKHLRQRPLHRLPSRPSLQLSQRRRPQRPPPLRHRHSLTLGPSRTCLGRRFNKFLSKFFLNFSLHTVIFNFVENRIWTAGGSSRFSI